MTKSYNHSATQVNPSLFPADPPLEAFDRCQPNVVLRLARFGVNFEKYRPLLEKAVQDGRINRKLKAWASRGSSSAPLFKSSAGRPPFDAVLMFRIVFLGIITHASDAEMSRAILSDSITRLFLKVPPGTFISRQAIWDYRDFFVKSGVCELITNSHLDELRQQGLLDDTGALILDGSFVEAPKQRNTREENQQIKNGQGAKLWCDQPAKKRQKDTNARWAKKNKETHFGYKVHALVDAVSKIIVYCTTTAANVHDSKALDKVLNEDEDRGRVLYADSAYSGDALEKLTKSFNVIPCFCEKGYKNHPLTEKQKANNREKSKTRCRIEHVFGHIQTVFKGSYVRSIGVDRATAYNWLIMLGCNLCRQEMLLRHLE